MRYYHICFRGNSEDIKNDGEVERVIDHGYGSILFRMNDFLWKNTKNNIVFFFYQEEGNALSAILAYDEQVYSFAAVDDFITGFLCENFMITKKISDYHEITMIGFMERMIEGERREHIPMSNRARTASHLWYSPYLINCDMEKDIPYNYSERIIDKDTDSNTEKIYDSKFIEELKNIEAHPNESELSVNMVHYIISGKSVAATNDMVCSLAKNLIEANRLQSGRMEIIIEISPELFKRRNYLEEIIENNNGGTIVF